MGPQSTVKTMMNITPELFYESFEAVATEHQPEVIRCWDSRPEYTRLIRRPFLPALADRLNLRCYSDKDYYGLDAVFYVSADTAHFPAGTTYVEYISIALEHEHTPGGTYLEMNKLQLFNCPLKVLITYPNSEQATNPLTEYADIVTRADVVFKDISTLRRQLIFGQRGPEFGRRGPEWKAYVFQGEQFQPLKSSRSQA